MIRTLLLSLWGAGVAVGVLYLALKPASEEAIKAAEAEKKIEKPNLFSEPVLLVAPILNETDVKGYLFARASVEVKAKAMAKLRIPIEMILQDAYNEYLIGNEKYTFSRSTQFDMADFRSGIETAVAKNWGEGKVANVIVKDINFVPAINVRRPGKLKTLEIQEPVEEKMSDDKPKKKDK